MSKLLEDLGCEDKHDVDVSVLSPEVRRRISGSSSAGQVCVPCVLLRLDGISVCQDGPDAMTNMFAIHHKISGVRG